MDPTNPFLILRLPSNASSADIKRAGQMAVASARLAGGDSADAQRHLKEVESAVERLRDPVARIRYGLAWPALGPASAERLKHNTRLLEMVLDPDADLGSEVDGLIAGESAHVRAHAQSVFMLLRASVILRKCVQATDGGGLSSGLWVGAGCRFLQDGLAQWGYATGAREFWLELRLRAKELGDPRIDADFLQRLEAEAASVPLVHFSEISREMLRVRDGSACKQLVQALRKGSNAREQLDSVLSDMYGPTCARATATIDGIAADLKSLKSDQPAPYEALVNRFQREVAPDVDLILTVGDLPGYSEELVRDKATELLRSLAVAAANKASAFDVSERALAIAARAANSAALRAKVEEDQRTVSRLMAQSRVAAKSKPISDRLQKALGERNHRGAIQALDELLSVCDPEDAAGLRELRQKVSTGYASELYNRGIECARVGDRANALAHLQEARRYETVPSEQAIIDRALASVRSGSGAAQSRGCLVPIAIVIGVIGLGASAAAPWLSAALRGIAFLASGSLEVAP